MTVNEPQIWTMLGALIAPTFGLLTAVSTLFVRVLRAEIGGLRGGDRSACSTVDWCEFVAGSHSRDLESIDSSPSSR